jgi:hypothetical protein
MAFKMKGMTFGKGTTENSPNKLGVGLAVASLGAKKVAKKTARGVGSAKAMAGKAITKVAKAGGRMRSKSIKDKVKSFNPSAVHGVKMRKPPR